MIKDIKNEMDKSTADKIKYCIVHEPINTDMYIWSCRELMKAVEEETISDEEDEEIRKVLSCLNEDDPIYMLARKRAMYHVKLLDLRIIYNTRIKIEKIKEIIKSTGLDKSVGDHIKECIRQFGEQWYLWDEVVLKNEPEQYYFWAVAFYEMRYENEEWKRIVDDILKIVISYQ